MTGDRKSATELLEGAAAELAQIHRGKDYGLWRQDRAPQLRDELAGLEPFNAFRDVWIYSGDGGCVTANPRFGEWAIDRLVEHTAPRAILAAFADEVARNIGQYSEVSPVFGVQIDARCELGEGIALIFEPKELFASLLHRAPFQSMPLPT